MLYRVKVEWENEDGSISSANLGQVERGPCESAGDVGLKLAEAQALLAPLQQIVVSQQLQKYCADARFCPSCHASRNVKDHRVRRLDTALGRVAVDTPRFDGCRFCGQDKAGSPISRILPKRVAPELEHLQAKLAAELPYRRAAALLKDLLPASGGLTPVTTGSRALALGEHIEKELCHEVDNPQTSAEPAEHLTVGIDGAFVKARCSAGERRHFEILTWRIEKVRGQGEVFGIVRDLDKRAKQKVQAVLRCCGRGPKTDITVLSDGEDGLRGVVGWFGGKCRHQLDWFHVARRLERIRKDLLYLPTSRDFGKRLAFHSRNLDRVKWTLWNEMPDHKVCST